MLPTAFLNKSLPGLSSMPLEGQFLCCALSVLAIALYKNFPQKCSRVFVVLIAAKATAWAMYVFNGRTQTVFVC